MISIYTIVILGLMVAAALWTLLWGLRPMWVTGGGSGAEGPAEPTPLGRTLTVVVFASCDEAVLGEWIEAVLAQDYADFDVVVVYDANAEMTAGLAERYADEKRLYFTFIPPGSHTLNRRKLALTIGIKAAKGEYVLTTIPQVKIPSTQWLTQMMTPVNADEAKEVVLGFSHFDLDRFGVMERVSARVSTVTVGSRWVGDALLGRPWRGDGNNLLFKRSLFFDNKGFADGLLLEGGDDDIFVDRIARGDNTAVCVTPETVLTVDWGTATRTIRRLAYKRYRSTQGLLPKSPAMSRNACRIIGWGMVPAAALAAFASWFGILADMLAGAVCLIFYLTEYMAYRKASRRLTV